MREPPRRVVGESGRSLFAFGLGGKVWANPVDLPDAEIPLSVSASSVLQKLLENVKGDYLFPGRSTEAPIVKVNAAHTATVKRCKVAAFR